MGNFLTPFLYLYDCRCFVVNKSIRPILIRANQGNHLYVNKSFGEKILIYGALPKERYFLILKSFFSEKIILILYDFSC